MTDPKFPHSPHCFAIEPEEREPEGDGLDVPEWYVAKIRAMMPALHAAVGSYLPRQDAHVQADVLGTGGVPELCADLRAAFAATRKLLANVRAAHQLHGDRGVK